MPDTPELDELEAQLNVEIQRRLRAMHRASEVRAETPAEIARRNARTADALRQARAPLADAVLDSMRKIAQQGGNDASREAFGTNPADFTRQDIEDLVSPRDLRNDVRLVISDAAMRIEGTRPSGGLVDLLDRVGQAVNRVANLAETWATRVYNRARRLFARRNRLEVVWFTREDERVCRVCEPMNDQVIAATGDFDIGAEHTARFHQFNGAPPAHFRCRCYVRVRQVRA